MLAAPSPPAPMLQGSFLRNAAPCRLSVSLCASISRRISGSGRVLCCDGSVSAPAVNPNSPPPPPPPPPPPAAAPAPALAPPILAPLPSASWYGAAHKERSNDRWSSGNETFRSVGSRSEPSRSSIPGKFSKYSKPISRLSEARRDRKAFRKPMGDIGAEPDRNLNSGDEPPGSPAPATELPKPKKAPVAPEEVPEWMREYQFSYSETPASPILGFRQHPWSPFGPPEMMERPWTGSAPLKPSKKKQKEFDSFNPPPAGKKGVKYVQRPGPFPPGEGPKPGKSREQILGAPLSPLEVNQLIAIVNKGNKQLNLGRDGLTHNMLDVIHSHWKRSLVCKIKCKGVPTVDMDNVAKVIEDKTGGVIIHRAGGVLYLFRGRNYNYKDRPQIPIMLWKPPDPIYPRLIQGIPKGLTLEEAKDLRARGRKVAPLCKLAKNGVYLTLVADVRAQFAVDDVVRVDCEGMNATDYKKIGAKLKELVPCTLLSFENEQIIMCRNKSVQAENGPLAADQDKELSEVSVDLDRSTNGTTIPATEQQASTMIEHYVQPVHTNDREQIADGNFQSGMAAVEGRQETLDMEPESVTEDSPAFKRKVESETVVADRQLQETALGEGEENYRDGSFNAATVEDGIDRSGGHQPGAVGVDAWNARSDQSSFAEDESSVEEASDDQLSKGDGQMEFLAENVSIEGRSAASDGYSESAADAGRDEFDELWQKAIEEGQALRLETESDPDVVLKQAAELSTALQDSGKDETSSNEKLETEADVKRSESSMQVPPTSPFDEMRPLRVDELAKLLAP